MVKVIQKFFKHEEIETISQALGDTNDGLTGTEIERLLKQARINDVDPDNTKWIRLHNAFVESQNKEKNRTYILQFIREALNPRDLYQIRNALIRYAVIQIKLYGFQVLKSMKKVSS